MKTAIALLCLSSFSLLAQAQTNRPIGNIPTIGGATVDGDALLATTFAGVAKRIAFTNLFVTGRTSNSIAIGNQIDASTKGSDQAVCIGTGLALAVDKGIAIGNAAFANTNCVSIGASTFALAPNCTIIGQNAESSGDWGIAIGIAAGNSAQTNNIFLGNNTGGPALDNQMVLGSVSPPTVNTLIMGKLNGNGLGITNLPYCVWSGTTGNALLSQATTYFFQPNNSSATLPTADVSGGTRAVVTRTTVLQNLYVVLSVAPAAAQNYTFTVMTNGVASSITKIVSAAATTGNDVNHTETIVAGTEWGIRIVSSATAAQSKITWSLEGMKPN